jgi:hypothetical protein
VAVQCGPNFMSTRPGRLSSSQVLSVGRISSVTSSSTVRPPCGCSVWASMPNAASTDSLTISPFKRPTSARQQQLRFASHLQLAMAPLRLVYLQRLGSLVGTCLPGPDRRCRAAASDCGLRRSSRLGAPPSKARRLKKAPSRIRRRAYKRAGLSHGQHAFDPQADRRGRERNR